MFWREKLPNRAANRRRHALLPPHSQGETNAARFCLHPLAMASAPTASEHHATAGAAPVPVRPPDLPPPAALPTSATAPVDRSRLSEQDDAVILQSLRAHLWSHGDLPRGADLVAAFFGRLSRTDYSLGDVEARIRALRRRFREADAALCDGTGGPAPGHDLRMYALSLEPFTPAPRAAAAPAPAKKRRCEEYPALAREAERLTREALERIDDVTAWSLEMRASKKEQRLLERMRKQYRQQQQRAGGVPAARRAEDGSKELASVMVNRGGHGPSSAGSQQR
ncbi:hypothetical protein D1007_43300 [Hordeum vulgare]|nr:hypothetical protein D1007_43300 [Hordeum vulgare]